MDLSTIKSVSPNRNLFKKMAALLFSLIVIIGSYIFLSNASKEATDVVEVIRVKPSDGIPAHALITEQYL